jgi:hypothetical protein
VTAFFSSRNFDIFVAWEQITPSQWVQIVAAICMSFFIPGYALIKVLEVNNRLKTLPKLLFSYVFSILITGFIGYVSGIAGFDSSETKNLLLVFYVIILALFFTSLWLKSSRKRNVKAVLKRKFSDGFVINSKSNFLDQIRNNFPQILVFGCLFAFVILSSYILYGGTLVGDQWFHHGRALLFMSGSLQSAVLQGTDIEYPSFFSAFLAAFFALSGSPTANAYVTINFLNIMPVFAFYYFFVSWVPTHTARAGLIASVLFMLSAGFGWIYVVSIAETSESSSSSDLSMLNILDEARIRTFDIFQPSTFVGVDHPGITSPLLIIGLPAGLVLLGIIKEHGKGEPYLSRVGYAVFIFVVTLVGILAHSEFFLFIIIVSFLILAFKLRHSNIVFGALIIAIVFPTVLQLIGFKTEYSIFNNEIYGFPLVPIVLAFVSIVWSLSVARNWLADRFEVSPKFRIHSVERIKEMKLIRRPLWRKKRIMVITAISIVSLVAYFYIFSFFIWKELSLEDIQVQTSTLGQRNIPWYLYPMKLGFTGLLGIAFLLSYLFRRFEKEIFVFGVIALVSLVIGPYYDEHRFSKYVMMGMAGFASLLLFDIIVKNKSVLHTSASARKPLVLGIILGLTVTLSGLSVFMYWGYAALAMENDFKPYSTDLPKREFPSNQEIEMLSFLYGHSINGKNGVVIPVDQYDIDREGFAGKLQAFAGIPYYRILQGKSVLGSNTIEGLYNLLNSTNTRYIMVSKNDTDAMSIDTTNEGANRTGFSPITEPVRFVTNNFEIAYQNSDYTVLSVPHNLKPPSSDGNLGFINLYDKSASSPAFFSSGLSLPYLPLEVSESNITRLQYDDNKSFSTGSHDKYVTFNKDNSSSNTDESPNSASIPYTYATLYNKTGEETLWSKPINDTNINYIENRLKIPENETKGNKLSEKVAGVVWIDGRGSLEKEYYVFLSSSALQLKITDKQEEDNRELRFQNRNMKLEDGVWYNIQVFLEEKKINVYVNNVLGLQVPRLSPSTLSIRSNQDLSAVNSYDPEVSRIGIRSDKTNAIFGPLEVGYVTLHTDSGLINQVSPKSEYLEYYYPLSILAMDVNSTGYDVYSKGDLSAFSKKTIMLPLDPIEPKSDVQNGISEGRDKNGDLVTTGGNNYASSDMYLDFVKGGGTLIVMNPFDYFSGNSTDGEFGRLLSIRPGNMTSFDHIGLLGPGGGSEEEKSGLREGAESIKASGTVRNLSSSSSDTVLRSIYFKNDKPVAPFVMEKEYPSSDGKKGKIIYVNIAGYYNSLDESQDDTFHTIENVMSLIRPNKDDAIQGDNHDNIDTASSRMFTRVDSGIAANSSDHEFEEVITGYMKTSGKTALNSSSLLLFGGIEDPPYSLKAENLYFTDRNSNRSTNYSNVTIKNLIPKGLYSATIYANGNLSIPSSPPHYDYIPILLPPDFDLGIKLFSNASARIVLDNSTLNISEDSDVRIQGIRPESNNLEYTQILMKDPKIESNGATSFDGLDSARMPQPYGSGEIHQGSFNGRIEDADLYFELNQDGFYETKFITRVQSPASLKDDEFVAGRTDRTLNTLEVPGDVSLASKEQQTIIPWQEAMSSPQNIFLMITIALVGVWSYRKI